MVVKNMNKSVQFLGLVAACSFAPMLLCKAEEVKNDLVNALADGKKIAFIDSMSMGRGWDAAMEIGKEFQEKEDELRRVFQEKQHKYVQAKTEHDKKAGVQSKQARESEEKKLAKMERELQEFGKECQEEFQALYVQRSEQLDKELKNMAAVIAKEMQLDGVVDIATNRWLYASERVDISHVLVDAMNKDRQQRLAQANPSQAKPKATA
jgi:Skp family chaperone for outer membrane proteins